MSSSNIEVVGCQRLLAAIVKQSLVDFKYLASVRDGKRKRATWHYATMDAPIFLTSDPLRAVVSMLGAGDYARREILASVGLG